MRKPVFVFTDQIGRKPGSVATKLEARNCVYMTLRDEANNKGADQLCYFVCLFLNT